MDPTTWVNLKLIFDISNVSMGLSIAYLLAMFGYYDTKKERITTFKMASSVIIMCYLVKM
jgi:hypothetical protein